ncbi:sodium:solute symporter [bacterium]|nr:sodium:solute symporter [bacterium]
MNLTGLDWTLVALLLAFMIISVTASKSLMKSVSDFLAAGRSAGRYIMSVSAGVAGLGAITIVGNLEMNLVAGFSMAWWGMTMGVVILILKVSGWVIYRFRQTRALTLAQFFEMRYSRSFRIFAGLVAFASGLINFGIFPAVGARFFIYFCGLPQHFDLLGMTLSTFPLVMVALLSISLYFVFSGGQIAVIIADFIQGVFINLVFIAILIYFFVQFDWSQIATVLADRPVGQSLINPFDTSHVKDFNFWYFLIGIFGVIYGAMSWQGTQAYNSSARNAHEAKMGGVLDGWRGLPQNLFFLFLPIIAYTVLNHPDLLGLASKVQGTLTTVDGEAIRSQLTVPLVLVEILPKGLVGAFVAVMLAAFISTHDTYLHSWGSIFIQDVIMPFRTEPYSPKTHLKVLRWSIFGVAVFIFTFSMLFKQSQYIFLFFAITGAIFAGGSGAVIIGGLYWKRGSTAAAWTAMLTGSSIAVGGIIIHQVVDDFPINGQMFWAIAMFASTLLYVLVSLLGPKHEHDMDELLNRGTFAMEDEQRVITPEPSRGWKLLGMGREFTRGDKLIYIGNYVWTLGWTLVFVVGTIYNLSHDVSNEAWMKFWRIYLLIHIIMASAVFLWFVIGGLSDLKQMITRLRTLVRDSNDDGFVRRTAAPLNPEEER